MNFKIHFLFKYILLIMLLQLSHSFPLLYSPPSCTSTPQFMSMGHTRKFLGFSISYTILNFPLSIFYLPFMLLIPCTFSSPLPPPLPTDNSPSDLHFCDSIPVLVVCSSFCHLGSVVHSCEFIVIFLFLFLIFFFSLGKSL